MRNTLNNQKGFTLIELLLVIVILGLLAASVAPSFTNLMASSSTVSGRGTAGAIESSINALAGYNMLNGISPVIPAKLDTATGPFVCSSFNATTMALTAGCFGGVSQQPITSPYWKKSSDTSYVFTTSAITQTYTYDPTSGLFSCTSGTC